MMVKPNGQHLTLMQINLPICFDIISKIHHIDNVFGVSYKGYDESEESDSGFMIISGDVSWCPDLLYTSQQGPMDYYRVC
jgi:hypothetical protein